MSYSWSIEVAPGNGRLTAAPGALLFVPDPADGQVAASLATAVAESEGNTADGDGPLGEAVAEIVLRDLDRAPDFVLVTWPVDHDGRLLVMVRGDTAVSSDLASVPSLSGAASPTWTEHRVPGSPDSADFEFGAGSLSWTRLIEGTVPAGGLRLALRRVVSSPTAAVHPVEADRPGRRQLADPSTRSGAPNAASDSPSAPMAAESSQPSTGSAGSPRSGRGSTNGLDALAAAVDPDWTEGSGPTPDPTREARSQAPEQHGAVPLSSSVEPEPAPEHEPTLEREVKPPHGGPPPRPAFDDEPPPAPTPSADESTLTEADVSPMVNESSAEPPPRRLAVVRSRLCPSQHSNPPYAMTCRRCGVPLASDVDELTIEQPVLATLVIDRLAPVPLDDRLAIGRNPTLAAARQRTGRVLSIEGPLEVSRTHCVVTADGWQITVTDCGSTAGTALLTSGSTDPVMLQAWLPHEAEVGDTIFLGGPTAVRLTDPALEAP